MAVRAMLEMALPPVFGKENDMKSPLDKDKGFYGIHSSPFIRLSGRLKSQNIVAVLLCVSVLLVSSLLVFPASALAAGSITLSPTSGQVGSTMTASGSGWAASTNYYLWFDSNGNGIKDSGEPYRALITDSSGAFSATLSSLPLVPAGTYNICFDLGQNGSIEASAPFTIIGKLNLTPTLGPPGTSVSAATNSNGFAASSSGYIWFDTDNDNAVDAGEPQAAVTTAANGTIASSDSLSVPLVAAGSYQVRVDILPDGSVDASHSFTVQAGISLSPASGASGTVITVTGGGFTINTAGNVWFDTDGDSVIDADEPQVAVTSTDIGAIPAGTTLTAPTLPPVTSKYVRADIPPGSPIEASASFSTPATTTYLTVTKYNAHGNVQDQTTVTYQEMEDMPVQNEEGNRYYHQGPTFDASSFDKLWNPGETVNVDSRDYGRAKGTDVKDLCELVGG